MSSRLASSWAVVKTFFRKVYLRVFGIPLLVLFLGIQLARYVAKKISSDGAGEEKNHGRKP